METPDYITRRRIVGGNLAFDFLNTGGGESARPDDEALRGYQDLVAWGRYVGLLTDPESRRLSRRARQHPADAHDALESAKRLRSRLDGLFDALTSGERPTRQSLAGLRSDEAEALAAAELVQGPAGFYWSWARDDSLLRPVWPVVHAAIELLTAGPLERVKRCDGCRYWFIDESKNQSRRWCSMDDCGAAEKAQRYVARRAAARRQSRATGSPPG